MNTIKWYLYVLRLESGHLYTGISTDVERRLAEHRSGKGAKYLRGKGHLDPVFIRPVGDRSAALKCEAFVKKLRKQQKEQLVTGEFTLPDFD